MVTGRDQQWHLLAVGDHRDVAPGWAIAPVDHEVDVLAGIDRGMN